MQPFLPIGKVFYSRGACITDVVGTVRWEGREREKR